MENFIKCILAGRGGTSSEALIRLIVEGKGTATQIVGSTFDPSGYIFKTMTNMGVVQTLSNNDSELKFYTNDAYTDTVLKADTKTIYVKYRNVSTTINLTEMPSKKIIPISFKNNRWELSNCPTYNGNEQTIDFESIGLIPKDGQPISGTNVTADGHIVKINSINDDWQVPSPGGTVESVYWNIRPAHQRINFSLSNNISITEQSITITQKSMQCTIPVNIATTNNAPADYSVTQSGDLIVNFDNEGLHLDFSQGGNVLDQLNYYAGNIRFSSANFVYDFYLNDIKLGVLDNAFDIITNITTYGVITDDWNTIISNPDGYELGAIKVLEAESGKEIAGTAQWQMQLVNKTDDGILTFYSTNTSTNAIKATERDLNSITVTDFKNFVNDSNILKVPSSYNCEIDDTYTYSYSISNSSKFWIGTPSQLGYEDSGITDFSKFNLVNRKKNHWLAGHVSAYEAASNGDFYIDSDSTTLNVTIENVSYPIRLGFSISKDMTANVPTITEGATLNDLNNFIKAKKAGASATYESKEFEPGSRFKIPEKFRLSDGTTLTGVVYITDIDKINNIVTLQSSYLMQDEDIYLIKIGGDSSTEFSEFNAAESYETSNLRRYYDSIAPMVDGVLPTTIEIQPYAYATNKQYNQNNKTYTYNLVSAGKSQITVSSCYPPSATELGLTNYTNILSNGYTYRYIISNNAKLGKVSQYPIGDQKELKTMFDVSNSPSWWMRLRDNLNTSTAVPVYRQGTLGINNGVLEEVNPGGYDNSKLHARYHYYALTPRFRIGG